MKFIYILMLMFSLDALADDVSNYRYYQKWKTRPNSKDNGSVYIRNDDPCITVYNKKKDSKKRYCQMEPSQLNLEKSYPTIYPARINFDGANLFFLVAAPWAEQKCKIHLGREEIQCEPTGK
ncbi:hypothetical protein L4174_020440 [Photobacterium sp. CCB-ST2H9]|uniref:hypothetical protein n=1 Tax=Photobacterium sp. CCB-ST2H9 TaxID=2912855 RepID=UPI0020050113|nr:hypothetical protein [Photobacterium sp. CCB-ST2H9]UTM59084.1 hypothetical protein L4174_020440 [Photobacterium sp. CCB-ST2H9]